MTDSRGSPAASAKVTVEQTGPVRAVVKLRASTRAKSGREWLPFTRAAVFLRRRDVGAHGAHDLLRWRPGEGFHPRPGRHVRRADARGGPEPPCAFLRRGRRPVVRADPAADRALGRVAHLSPTPAATTSIPTQLAGPARAQPRADEPAGPQHGQQLGGVGRLQAGAAQPDGFTIQKRTNPQSTWLFSAAGKRASGLRRLSAT